MTLNRLSDTPIPEAIGRELVPRLNGRPIARHDLAAVKLGRELDLAHNQRQHDFGLHHGEFLADAAARALLERPPRVAARGREELAVRKRRLAGDEALGDELHGPREEALVAVDHVRHGPDVEADHGILGPRGRVRDVRRLGGGDVGRGLQLADRAGRREQPQHLLDDGGQVFKPVDAVRVRLDGVGQLGGRVAFRKHGAQLGHELLVHGRVQVEEVHGVGDGAGRGVVPREDEGLDAVDGHAAERGRHGAAATLLVRIARGEFLLVRVQCQVDDGALAFFLRTAAATGMSIRVLAHGLFARLDFLVDLGAQQGVELAHVQPQLDRAHEVDIVKGADARGVGHQRDLLAERGHDGVGLFLRVKVRVHDHLADDVDGEPDRQRVQLDQFARRGFTAQQVQEHQARVHDVRDQCDQMACAKARVEDGAQRFPRRSLQAYHVGLAEQFVEVASHELRLGQHLARREELRCEFWVRDEEPSRAKGPPVEVVDVYPGEYKVS